MIERIHHSHAARAAATILGAILLAVPAFSAAMSPPSEVDASCERHDLDVRLLALDPTTYHLAGWICGTSPYAGQTVILASPTGLADHAYWDWPLEPETYSFVRHATQAGYAVFNYDRIGTGLSDRPNAALVTLESEAYVAHQIVSALRTGAIGGVPFGKVVTIGNSFGTFIAIMEAELYHDVDGVINTGVFVGAYPDGLLELFATFYPAQLDPKFANEAIPLGYATTQPGSRVLFFHMPTADPAVVALDETLKETATAGEAVTFGHWMPFTKRIDVPVLSVMGDHDFLFCAPECQPGGIESQKEALFWGPEACLEIEIVDEAGHAVQLQAAPAAAFHAIADDWLARRIGADIEHEPTQAC